MVIFITGAGGRDKRKRWGKRRGAIQNDQSAIIRRNHETRSKTLDGVSPVGCLCGCHDFGRDHDRPTWCLVGQVLSRAPFVALSSADCKRRMRQQVVRLVTILSQGAHLNGGGD